MFARDKILDDIARVAGGSVSVLAGLRQQISEDIRTRVDEMAQRMDLVPRADFERLETLLIQAREEQAAMEKRVAALEKGQKTTKATPTKKPTTKKKTQNKKS